MKMHMRSPFNVVVGAGLVVVATVSLALAQSGMVRESRFFRVDVANQKVLEPLPRVGGALRLQLASVTTDQPQYWPQEKVFLKVIMPGAPGVKVKGTVTRRDASGTPVEGTLDEGGVLVLTVLDGASKRLQLGEYRVDVATSDGALKGDATFSVVEGALGAVSLAYPFERVTSADSLDALKAGWFLGNAGGAGKRWGNGLSFKNQLRVANQKYTGEVEVHSRCMLPGCNGVDAGPARKVHVHDGVIEGTMDVGGHSGPFQIEVITPRGTLRHQFEGSSHVERDMVAVSGGVTFQHRAGMAPYEGTTQVPGRQIYVESRRGTEDAWELPSTVATNGAVTLVARRNIRNARITLFNAQANGAFSAREVPVNGDLSTGQEIRVPVDQPFTFVAAAGFVQKSFVEGWAIVFSPSALRVSVQGPGAGMPGREIQVDVQVTDTAGAGRSVSGILEVFDNRVASRHPLHPLGSAIGESFRSASQSMQYWEDRTGIDEEAERRKAERESREMEKMADEAAPKKSMRAGGAPSLSRSALQMGAPPPPPAAPMPVVAGKMAPGTPAAQGRPTHPQQEEAPEEVIRENEQKVVFCGRVKTDAQGRARIPVTLPPQTGRVTIRFVAVSGMDHQDAETGADIKRDAFVEVQMPRTFVPGATLSIAALVVNQAGGPVTLRASGGGLKAFTTDVPQGNKIVPLAWTPVEDGVAVVELLRNGKPLDVRRMEVRGATRQAVTYSRIVVEDGSPVSVGVGETLTAYASAGHLMRGMSMNMLTTMESWFGHAEALGARAATTAVMLAAMQRGVLQDDGVRQPLLAMHEKSTRDLEEAFLDGGTNLIRPYPGLPGNPQWSVWVSASLHDALNVLRATPVPDALVQESVARMGNLCERIDTELRRRGINTEEQGGYDAQGRAVIPVEVDGKVLYRVPTDDTVTRWAVEKLVPEVGRLPAGKDPVEVSRLVDTFRFLKAFERVGLQQYLAEVARGLWEHGDRAAAVKLTGAITRNMILAQDPGMLQGPALLGGVYSAPRAMVRFLELLLVMGAQPAANGPVTVVGGGKPGVVDVGQAVSGPATVKLPAGAVARVDVAGVVDGARLVDRREVKAAVDLAKARVGQQVHLTVELPASMDPLEYVALVAVPSTTTIKQTEDILSDHRGALLYGQQQQGGTLMQLIAVPFRGSRTMTLWLEGARPGSSPGWMVIRHIENPQDAGRVALPVVTVTE